MALRTQLSLIFSDEELFNGLIIPYKANKELTPLVIRLLSSYYYDENVRNAVDGFSEEGFIEEELQEQTAFSEAARKARETLAMMNLLTEQATMLTEDGIDDMLSRMNDIAGATGGGVSADTEFGASMPFIGDALPDLRANEQGVSLKTEESSPVGVSAPVEHINEAELKQELSNMVDQRMASVDEVLKQHSDSLVNIMDMLKQLGSQLQRPVAVEGDSSVSLNNEASQNEAVVIPEGSPNEMNTIEGTSVNISSEVAVTPKVEENNGVSAKEERLSDDFVSSSAASDAVQSKDIAVEGIPAEVELHNNVVEEASSDKDIEVSEYSISSKTDVITSSSDNDVSENGASGVDSLLAFMENGAVFSFDVD